LTAWNELRLLRQVSRCRLKDGLKAPNKGIRIFIPVPEKFLNIALPWLERELEVYIEPFNLGFGVLVYPEDSLLGLYPMSQRFRYLLRQLESEAGISKKRA
jgi:hypothetical protein